MTDETRSTNPSRPLPHDTDAEAALLGAAMLSRKALAVLCTETRPEDFYVVKHATIARSLVDAFEHGWETDYLTVRAHLDGLKLLETIGDPGYLVELTSTTPATSSAPRYAHIVHEHATLRRLLIAAREIEELGYAGGDAHKAVVAAQARLGSVASQNGARSYSALEVADTATLLEGDLEAPDADFLSRSDGLNLIYAGKMHVFQAEPSTGKTWLALAAADEVLTLGGAVVYLDWEDSSRGVLGRLLALGADPAAVAARFQYVQPVGPFGQAERLVLNEILERLNPDLVVIDGVAEALARDGYSEDKASDVVAWGEKLPRPIAQSGAAVIMLDHVVKSKEDQGRWARGSGAKLGMIDGAAYSLKTSAGFSRKKSGGMRVVIAKDRPGGVGTIGETAAMISVEPHADGTRVVLKIEPDTAAKRITDPFRPTGLMAKVSHEVQTTTVPLTAKAVRALIHSDKPKFVSEAIARLLAEGYLRETRQGSTVFLVHVKPYTGDGDQPRTDEGPLEDNPELFGPEADLPDNVHPIAGRSDYSEDF